MDLKIKNPFIYSVALYIRLSKEDKKKELSESVINQQSLLKNFAHSNNLKIYKTYIDDGFSGTNFDRPAFKQMLFDIELKKINMVITKDLSRLGRDYILTGHYIERYFPEKNVRYIALLDDIDTQSNTNYNDLTPFKAIINDMYSKDISKKIKSVKHHKQLKGEFIGGKAYYGYKKHPTQKNKIIIDENVSHIVKTIFNMALSNMSCRQIAVELNKQKIEPPSIYAKIKNKSSSPYKGMWNSEKISEMLQNEVYIGNMVQGRVLKLNYKSKKCIKKDRKDWIVVRETHEPIIEKQTFEKVQILLNTRKNTRTRNYDFLLKGLIFCHECGYPLAVINRKTKSGKDRLFFICRTYQRFTKSGVCTCHSIKEQTVTEVVISKLKEFCDLYLNISFLKPTAQNTIKFLNYEEKKTNQLELLKNKIENLNKNIEDLYMDKLNNNLLQSDFDKIYKNITKQRENLIKKKNILQAEQKSNLYANSNENLENLINQFINSAYKNKELLTSLIERIELTKDKQIIINFRFKQPQNECSISKT